MAEFASYYYEKGTKEIMSPHPLKPFKGDWNSWNSKTIRFQELAYIGDEKNITLYFKPIDDKQASFSNKEKQVSPVENPCYFSLSGESEFEKIFRSILLAYLEPFTCYGKNELALGDILKATILVEQVKSPEQDLSDFLLHTCTKPLGFLKKFKKLESPEFLTQEMIKLIEPTENKWSGSSSKGQTELEKAKDRVALLKEYLHSESLDDVWNLVLGGESISFNEMSIISYGLAMGYESAWQELLRRAAKPAE
ncbi:MAG TPA: hypothetical protein DEP38_15250 [Cyanobacteria bacterium UBA9226]|nr:hypothetical protein [Cyanobacteria bacterium UBA9226]